jgi:competence protein ComEA
VKKLLNIRPVNDWFGYTRRERRSTFFLLILILVIIVIRYAIPEKNIDAVNAGPVYSDSLSLSEIAGEELTRENMPYDFDPNRASYDTLLKIGLDSREAKTLVSYRNKGGKFRKPSDIRKVYGIDSLKSEKLMPHVDITSELSTGADSHPQVQRKPQLNLNHCDSTSLMALPGIGPVLSVRIIRYRNLLGGFARVDQLREVYGLPEETFQLIKYRVFADSSAVRRIKINSSDYKVLGRIPYIEKYEVSAIMKYRELAGRVSGMEDLMKNKILSSEKGKKIGAYIDFE